MTSWWCAKLMRRSEASLESILEVQDRYDNHFDDSPVWHQALAARL
jgi:hypothetical protein